MSFNKGDIVHTTPDNRDKKRLRHPAVVWEGGTAGHDFIGIMLTHSEPSGGFDNVAMQAEHFCDGFASNGTHFVNQKFIKLADWGPFIKKGRLTDVGISFIEKNISKKAPLPFETYIRTP